MKSFCRTGIDNRKIKIMERNVEYTPINYRNFVIHKILFKIMTCTYFVKCNNLQMNYLSTELMKISINLINMKKLTIFLLVAFFSAPSLVQANDDIDRVKLLFVGDIMGHSPQIQSAYNAATKSYDYTPCFKYVQPIIEAADLAIGNLEVTLSDKGTYTGYPMFRSPDALANALKTAGFDMLVTSNNHSNDNGAYGVTHTIDVLENLNFYHTGTFRNQAEKDLYYPLIIYKNNFKLAFLNYTYGTNGMPTVAPTIVNQIVETAIKNDIAAAEKLQPDAIIVIMHWGLEYQLNENSVQYELAKKIFEWGANLVIGSHPHVIQPIKKLPFTSKTGEQKTGLTVFSLGNFISNQQQPNTDGGLMVEIELTKKKDDKKAKIGECAYIPIWRYKNNVNSKSPYGTYYALPISAFESGNTADLVLTSTAKANMISFGTRMRQHLGKHEGKERMITMDDLQSKKTKSGVGAVGKNPYSKFASYEIPATTEIVDTNSPHFIMPVEYNNYIIHDRNYETAPIVKSIPTPAPPASATVNTLPKGSVTKGDEAKPTTPVKTTKATGNDPESKYLVQFQTSKRLQTKLPFQNVIVKEEDGLFKYFLDAGNDLTTAKSVLATVKNGGFADAFVVFNKIENVATTTTYPDGSTAKDGEESMLPPNKPSSKPISTTGASNDLKDKYLVQFQTSKSLYSANLPFENVIVKETNGLFKYYLGAGNDLTNARTLLENVKNAGFPDAFVVINKLDEEPVDTENTEKNGEMKVYKVQFQSSPNLGVPDKLPIDDYEIIETTDGRFLYFAGKANTVTEAMTLLKQIQAAGYKDAFVVPFVNGKPN